MLHGICLLYLIHLSTLSAKQRDKNLRSERAQWPLGLKRISAVPAAEQSLSQERGKKDFFSCFPGWRSRFLWGWGAWHDHPRALSSMCRRAHRLLPVEWWRDGRRPVLWPCRFISTLLKRVFRHVHLMEGTAEEQSQRDIHTVQHREKCICKPRRR